LVLLTSFICTFVLKYCRNDYIIFSSSGGKQCALGDFIKFRGEGVAHHNHSIPKLCLSVGITTCLIRGAHLPIPDLEHDHPLRIVEDAMGYFVLWLWKQTISFYKQLCYIVYIETNKP
jgi:hypothetical protein